VRFLIAIAVILLAACSSKEKLATARGPVFPLNVGRWQPTEAELHKPADEAR